MNNVRERSPMQYNSIERIIKPSLTAAERLILTLQEIADLTPRDGSQKAKIVMGNQTFSLGEIGLYAIIDLKECHARDFQGEHTRKILERFKIKTEDEVVVRIFATELTTLEDAKYGCTVSLYPKISGEGRAGFEFATSRRSPLAILEAGTGRLKSQTYGPDVQDTLEKRAHYIEVMKQNPDFRANVLNELVTCGLSIIKSGKPIDIYK